MNAAVASGGLLSNRQSYKCLLFSHFTEFCAPETQNVALEKGICSRSGIIIERTLFTYLLMMNESLESRAEVRNWMSSGPSSANLESSWLQWSDADVRFIPSNLSMYSL